MDLPSNPLAVLTFISAPAVLTNASSVLLFGTGNRYGRAVDRAHELADMVFKESGEDTAETKLRIRQMDSAQRRVLLIVQALTCFYTAVAALVASTLVSLIGGILVTTRNSEGAPIAFTVALITGAIGVLGIISGAVMLSIETRYSYSVLREERAFITDRVHKLQQAP